MRGLDFIHTAACAGVGDEPKKEEPAVNRGHF
jgi:hypothetical protein